VQHKGEFEMTMTATKALNAVRKSAEQIRNDSLQRFPEAASTGDTWRQGDIYIEKLDAVPKGAVRESKPKSQLAPGTTQGSRHILDSLQGVTMYRLASPTVLDGPILDLATERVITHPEHGDVALPPGVYGITYQRAWADELRRQQD
jgi:hypothetical protein